MANGKVTVKITGDNSQANQAIQQTANEISKFSNKAKASLKALNDLNKNALGAAQSIQNIGSAIAQGNFTGLITGITSALNSMGGFIGAMKGGQLAVTGLNTAIKSLVLNPIFLAITGVVSLGAAVVKAGKDFASFQQKSAELKSLTGLSDDVIKPLETLIINTAKEFNANSEDIVESMKNIGSARPELLSDADALLQVTKSANVLAKAGLMSVDEAAKGLTTVLNLMNLSATESDNIINTLAKAQLAGSVSIEGIKTAFEKSGTAASMAGLSYQDLIASIETIGPKFGSVDVLGTHLSGTLMKLSTLTNDNFNPAVVGLDKALDNLAAANLTTAEKAKLFGQANIDAANALIEGREAMKAMRSEITGTNSAYEQFAINTDTVLNKSQSLTTGIAENFKLLGKLLYDGGASDGIKNIIDYLNQLQEIVFNAISAVVKFVLSFMQLTAVQMIIETIKASFSMVISIISAAIDIVMDIVDAFAEMFSTTNELGESINLLDMFKAGLEVIKNVLGYVLEAIRNLVLTILSNMKKVIEIIVAVGKAIVDKLRLPFLDVCNKIKSWWNTAISFVVDIWNKFVSIITNNPIAKSIIELTNKIKEAFKKAFDWIIKIWNKIKKTLGLGGEEIKIKEDVETTIKEEVKTTNTKPDNIIDNPIADTKSKVKVKVEAEEGSIKDLENKLSKLNDELNNKVVSDERLKEITKEKSELEKQIEEIKIRNGLLEKKPKEVKIVPAEGSLQYIQSKISSLETLIKSGVYLEGYDLSRCQDEIKEWKKKQEEEEIRIGVKVDTDKNVSIKLPKTENKVIEAGSNEDKLKSLHNANLMAQNTQKLVYEGILSPDEGKNVIDDLNKQLEGLGLQPISLVLDTREAEEKLLNTLKQMDMVKEATSSVGNVFSNLGSAIGGAAGDFMSFAGTAIQNIGLMIPQIISLIGASLAQAIATGTASAAAIPFPANLGAIASIVALLTSTFAALPAFANGGIIQGATTMGDYNLARVNGGEMILNNRQQGNLFSLLNGGYSETSSKKSDVNFRISGTNLVGTQKNYNKRISKLRG